MNILFLSTENPYPPDHGHHIRTYHILKTLAARHRVFFLAFAKTEAEAALKTAWEDCCASVDIILLPQTRWRRSVQPLCNFFSSQPFVVQRYVSRRAQQRIRQILKDHRIDAVHFDLPHLAWYLHEVRHLPKVLTHHNVEFLRVARWAEVEKNHLLKAYLHYQAHKLKRLEARLGPQFDRCIAVSEFDKDLLIDLSQCNNFSVIPNGVDADYFRPAPPGPRSAGLVWVGAMSGAYNRDAVDFFLSRIAPDLYARLPELPMTFVGSSPTSFLQKKVRDNPCITSTGYVDDVRPFVDRAAVFIAPLRSGSGTKVKILNAMSQGKPVVTTSVGAEGIIALPDQEILSADDEKQFVQKVLHLLHHPDEAAEIGKRARLVVEKFYDWKVVTAGMSAIYEQAVELKADRGLS